MDSERLTFQYTIGQPQTVDGRPLVFPHYDGELLREGGVRNWWRRWPASTRIWPPRASVEILNGTTVPGLARNAAPLLHELRLPDCAHRQRRAS